MKNSVSYIIISFKDGKTIFSNTKYADIVTGELGRRSSQTGEIELFCYCLLPGALHMLLSLTGLDTRSIKNWAPLFKSSITKRIRSIHGTDFLWDRGYREEVIHDQAGFHAAMGRILNLPETEGLAEYSDDYRYVRFIKMPVFPKKNILKNKG